MQTPNTRRDYTQEEKEVVMKTECHCRGILSGIFLIPSRCSDLIKAKALCYNNKEAGDPRLRASGMTPNLMSGSRLTYKASSGFTLIELLVAVLIIAILAAVALPQYQKVMYRIQGREALQAIDVLDKALHAYYLQHDTYEDISEENLDIKLPQLKYFNWTIDSSKEKKEIILESTPLVTTKLYIKTFLDNTKPLHKWYCTKSKNEAESSVGGITYWNTSIPLSCSNYFDCPRPVLSNTGSSTYWSVDSKCVLK